MIFLENKMKNTLIEPRIRPHERIINTLQIEKYEIKQNEAFSEILCRATFHETSGFSQQLVKSRSLTHAQPRILQLFFFI